MSKNSLQKRVLSYSVRFWELNGLKMLLGFRSKNLAVFRRAASSCSIGQRGSKMWRFSCLKVTDIVQRFFPFWVLLQISAICPVNKKTLSGSLWWLTTVAMIADLGDFSIACPFWSAQIPFWYFRGFHHYLAHTKRKTGPRPCWLKFVECSTISASGTRV